VGTASERLGLERRKKRAEALFRIDVTRRLRRAHENPAVKKLYEEFLGHPLSEKARKLLHTTYTPRRRNPVTKGGATSRTGVTAAAPAMLQ